MNLVLFKHGYCTIIPPQEKHLRVRQWAGHHCSSSESVLCSYKRITVRLRVLMQLWRLCCRFSLCETNAGGSGDEGVLLAFLMASTVTARLLWRLETCFLHSAWDHGLSNGSASLFFTVCKQTPTPCQTVKVSSRLLLLCYQCFCLNSASQSRAFTEAAKKRICVENFLLSNYWKHSMNRCSSISN